jgi:nitroreductase
VFEVIEADLFETMWNMRSMRRLKPDPIDPEIVSHIIECAVRAPNGQNTQPWSFLVVQDADAKQFLQRHYYEAMTERTGLTRPSDDDLSKSARSRRAAHHLAEHLHEAPVLLLVCGKRDWPFLVPPEERVGLAPPSFGSIYPCIQNILLACRAHGLGATLTTLHQLFQPQLHERFAIPETFGVVAMIPIGYPTGNFGPVRRNPIESCTFYDAWGTTEQP